MAIIRPKPLAPKTFYRGETFRGRLAIVNTDLTIKDLTGATVRWALMDEAGALALPELSLGNGVSFESGNPALGVLIVVVFDEDTEDLAAATYQQEFYITDNIGDVGVYRGKVFVENAELWATA